MKTLAPITSPRAFPAFTQGSSHPPHHRRPVDHSPLKHPRIASSASSSTEVSSSPLQNPLRYTTSSPALLPPFCICVAPLSSNFPAIRHAFSIGGVCSRLAHDRGRRVQSNTARPPSHRTESLSQHLVGKCPRCALVQMAHVLYRRGTRPLRDGPYPQYGYALSAGGQASGLPVSWCWVCAEPIYLLPFNP